ncbi:MAG: DUF3604 domain-containing protein [Gammaproteobacteria bacterium]
MDEARHQIIIVGGGAAGLELATALGKKLGKKQLADVILIDASRTHIWKPLLHEVAAGTLDSAEDELEYLAQARWCHFRYRLGRMVGLDRERQEVCLAATVNEEGMEIIPERRFRYDTLVVAVGSLSNDFGISGVKEHCLFLDTTAQAELFQRKLLDCMLKAHTQGKPIEKGQLDLAIVGAGATGVELAAQLHHVTRKLANYGLDTIDPDKHIRIHVIEAGPRILAALPERLSHAAEQELARLHVTVHVNQRVVEVTQPKGTGEAHPLLSPDDEFADFELMDKSNLTGTEAKTPEMLKTEYAREALKLGLSEEARVGVNPFKFGMIGSTDSHNAIPSTREENWFGKIHFVEPSPHRRDGYFIESKVDPSYSIRDIDLGASGLAAVWATENTREAIWDAFERREVFATTGTRLRVRLFAGWDFQEAEVQRPDFAAQGYLRGVPMGGDLRTGPKGASPTFMIRALRDPDGANLDRIQIIKGWLDDDGNTHERIYDVAVSGDRTIGPDGRCKERVGNTVDVANATYTNDIGEAVLAGYWKDPEFDPALRAFYYARVIESPTPRWTAYDAKFFDIEMPEGTAMQVTDRAYTSPIWYTP